MTAERVNAISALVEVDCTMHKSGEERLVLLQRLS